MNFISRFWTNVIKENLLAFIILTLIFTVMFNKLGSMGLSYLLNMNNESPFYYNYTLGIFGLIMLIPATVITLGLVMIWHKSSDTYSSSSTLQKIGGVVGISIKGLFKGIFMIIKVIFIILFLLIAIPVGLLSKNGSETPRERLRRDIAEGIRRGRY